ncbi:hypothetical protein V495_08153 [Pseudogymnoascus sp. VKM F-4514 (FW-929)]|nr:hypothetical protein V495_08153 [Pseudogymnoascus sp. VKM F-4514 (FW-929)]KFY59532.1 hypothetical protein V497_04225 [Pseudogymnoascus sp. VKM F-4516 (FW-969)]
MSTSNNASGVGITDPGEFARRSAAAIPDFNPYDALGIPAAAYTIDEVNQHFRRAQRHIVRASASAPAFPSRVDVNTARDYLLEVAARPAQRQRASYSRWESKPRTFYGELEIGDPGVFVSRATPRATPTPSPSGNGPRPSPRRPPGDPFWTPPPRPPRPPPRRRSRQQDRRSNSPKRSPPPTTPGSGTGAGTGTPGSARDGDFSGYTRRERTPPFGTSARNPYTVDDDDDEDDDEMPPPPTPTPSGTGTGSGTGAGRPSRARNAPPPPFAPFGFGRQAPPPPPPASPFGFTRPPTSGTGTGTPPPAPTPVSTSGTGTGTPPPSASMPRENRSTGATRARASPIANPVTGERIIVGTWAASPHAIPNAVVAIFDVRGRLNFRITNTTTTGAPVPAPTSTATSIRGINFRPPYAGLDLNALRVMINDHLHLPHEKRP